MSEAQGAAPMPIAHGGRLQSGTYVATRFEWFTDHVFQMRQLTLELNGNDAQLSERLTDSAGLSGSVSTTRINATFAPTDTGPLTLEQTCPRAVPLPFDGFTATADTLVLIDSSNRQVITFARQ